MLFWEEVYRRCLSEFIYINGLGPHAFIKLVQKGSNDDDEEEEEGMMSSPPPSHTTEVS